MAVYCDSVNIGKYWQTWNTTECFKPPLLMLWCLLIETQPRHQTSAQTPNFSPDSITLSESLINLDGTSGTFTTSRTSGSSGQPQATSSPDPSSTTQRGRKNKNAPTHMKVLNVNTQSILDKRARFQNLVDSTDPDIVIMTVTWLKPDKADGETGEAGRFACEYNIHRRDRPGKKTGGGVLIAVKNSA